MTPGRLIAVVGPSGVGKDSLIDALLSARTDLERVRRVVTREDGAGGEEITSVTEAEFRVMAESGDFVLWWTAHGLLYGIPVSVVDSLAAGRDAIVNLSRSVLDEARRAFPGLVILSMTAKPEVLAKRLSGRARESTAEIARRLQRADAHRVTGEDVIELDNSGPLRHAVGAAMAALYPERANR